MRASSQIIRAGLSEEMTSEPGSEDQERVGPMKIGSKGLPQREGKFKTQKHLEKERVT